MNPMMIPDDEIPEGYVRKVWAAHQPQYEPLPSLNGPGGEVFARWRLSENERRAIMDGANVHLQIWTYGRALQPHMLTVQGVEPEPAPPREQVIAEGNEA